MANLTYALQVRRAIVTNRTARYRIVMSVTDRGDLTDKAVFVKAIMDAGDPRNDVLVRVAGVGDMLTYRNNRDAAIRFREPYWRDVALIKEYDDLESAQVAADFLKERLNDLVTQFSTYINEFEADPGETTAYPQDDLGVLAPLLSDYAAKVREVHTQEETVAELDAQLQETANALTSAIAEVAGAGTILQELQATQAALQTVHNAMVAQYNASVRVSAEIVAALVAWENNRGSAGAPTQSAMDPTLQNPTGTLYSAYHNDFKGVVGDLARKLADIAAQISAVDTQINAQQARLSALESKKTALEQQRALESAEVTAAAAKLSELRRITADLLQQAQRLCPTFDGAV